MYPAIYHKACTHLVHHGSWGGDTEMGRRVCAKALRAIRSQYGRKRAMRERDHLRFISGQFPVKRSHPLHPSHD